VAQLGARFHGMEEVVGSIPTRSTKFPNNLNAGGRIYVVDLCGNPPILVPTFANLIRYNSYGEAGHPCRQWTD
jgi:hypothetical protein